MIAINQELEKIDLIRQRIPVSFEEASNALTKTGGDVVQALVLLENEQSFSSAMSERLQETASRVRGWLRRGSNTKLIVKQDEEVVVQLPVTAGLVGAILSPRLAFVGAVAAMVGGCRFDFEEEPEADPDVRDMVENEPLTH